MQFIKKFSSIVCKSHPAIAFRTLLSGSVSEGTKIIAADEYNSMCLLLLNGLTIKFHGQKQPTKVTCSVTSTTGTKIECQKSAVIFQCGVLDSALLVSHFHDACAEAFTHPELWNLNPHTYRLSSKDITAANRSISFLQISIHDEDHPWLKASMDIVPGIYTPDVPPNCTIPTTLKPEGCCTVIKWFSADPATTQSFLELASPCMILKYST